MRQAVSRKTRDDPWLAQQLSRVESKVRAPAGFTDRVMNAVYREMLAPRSTQAAAAARRSEAAAAEARRLSVLRLYRRIAVSLMLTGAVLAASLLVPHAAYSTLIGPGQDAALGKGPTEAVRTALADAGSRVQGALGELSIGGGQQ